MCLFSPLKISPSDTDLAITSCAAGHPEIDSIHVAVMAFCPFVLYLGLE